MLRRPAAALASGALAIAFADLDFKSTFRGQLGPPRPTAKALEAGTTATGRLLSQEGAVLQRGPFHSLWIRVGGSEVSTAALEDLVSNALEDQAARKVPGAVYVALDERNVASEHVRCLHRCGFRFHHHRTSTEAAAEAEYVYYRWPDRPDYPDKVPPYATATEGVGAIVLSPDETRVLLVWEYGCWKMPTGAVDASEGVLQALRRELREEVGCRVDSDFSPLYLGGWQNARAFDERVNNHFSVYAVRAQAEATHIDPNEAPRPPPLRTLCPPLLKAFPLRPPRPRADRGCALVRRHEAPSARGRRRRGESARGEPDAPRRSGALPGGGGAERRRARDADIDDAAAFGRDAAERARPRLRRDGQSRAYQIGVHLCGVVTQLGLKNFL